MKLFFKAGGLRICRWTPAVLRLLWKPHGHHWGFRPHHHWQPLHYHRGNEHNQKGWFWKLANSLVWGESVGGNLPSEYGWSLCPVTWVHWLRFSYWAIHSPMERTNTSTPLWPNPSWTLQILQLKTISNPDIQPMT